MSIKKFNELPYFLKSGLKAFTVLLILFLVWFLWATRPVSSKHTDVYYSVGLGQTFNGALKELKEKDVIRSYTAAKLVRNLFGMSLKRGEYVLSKDMGLYKILKILNTGMEPLIKITFPEGFSAIEIKNRLQAHGFSIASQDFMNEIKDPEVLSKFHITGISAEGYLFPSTYYVPKNITAKEFTELMIKTFFEETKNIINNVSEQTLQKDVILASIIEKEAVVDKDRPLIASVFLNRVAKGMKLESCATVIYIFEQQGQKKNRLFYKDLAVDSPYNTYKYPGFPAGPISNPGFESLKAAFNPAKTDYLFFVYKGNGEHVFTTNYADHMKYYKQYVQYQYMKKN